MFQPFFGDTKGLWSFERKERLLFVDERKTIMATNTYVRRCRRVESAVKNEHTHDKEAERFISCLSLFTADRWIYRLLLTTFNLPAVLLVVLFIFSIFYALPPQFHASRQGKKLLKFADERKKTRIVGGECYVCDAGSESQLLIIVRTY